MTVVRAGANLKAPGEVDACPALVRFCSAENEIRNLIRYEAGGFWVSS